MSGKNGQLREQRNFIMDTNPEPGVSAVGADEAVEAQLEYADASAPTGRKKLKDPPRAHAIADYAAVQVADYVRDAAKKIDHLADDLRDKSAGDLLSSATAYGRTHPLMMLAGGRGGLRTVPRDQSGRGQSDYASGDLRRPH